MFASPAQIGRLPWSYDQVWRVYQKAALRRESVGLGLIASSHVSVMAGFRGNSDRRATKADEAR